MQTFRKAERLCSKKVINELFEKGNNLLLYPLSIKWINVPPEKLHVPAKILFVASKKHFKLSVKRNRIKRLLRECYRKNKFFLYEFLLQNNISISFSVAYVDKNEPDYDFLNEKMVEILHLLMEQLKIKAEENNNEPV